MKRLSFVAIWLSILCIHIPAQEPPRAATAGLGSSSCATYIKETRQDKNKEFMYFAWAQGFMSGYNAGNYSPVCGDVTRS